MNKGYDTMPHTHTVLLTVQIAVHIDSAQLSNIPRTKQSLVDYAVGNLMLKRDPVPGMECSIVLTEKEVVYKLL